MTRFKSVYRPTSVEIPEKEIDGCFAIIDLNHEDVLYRGIKLIEDDQGAYVSYPTRKRVKNGMPVLNRYGEQFVDYIFKPCPGADEYYDTLIMNAFYKHEGQSEIDMKDIPFDDETKIVSINRMTQQMKNGFVGFCELQWKGMMINDIAIQKDFDGDYRMVFPHYKETHRDGTIVKKLFIYPQKDELVKITEMIMDSYHSVIV